MFTKLLAVFIAFVLVFGGVAATAYAAQDSLPPDALYPVKTLSESVALGLSVSSAQKLEKALGQAQRRVDEMAKLAAMGVSVPEKVNREYVERVEYSLRLAARIRDDQMSEALGKIQAGLQKQLAAVEQLRAARPDDAQLAVVEEQLHRQLGLVALGLSDPQAFREQLAAMLQGIQGPSSTQDPSVTEEPSKTETPEPGDDNSNDENSNDSNANDDVANGNDDDSNGNGDDANENDDDLNSNDDNANLNDNGTNENDDDGNINDDDMNENDDDNNGNDDNGGNGNDDDGVNGNDDNGGNGNGNDNDGGNGNDDDGGNGNGDDSGHGGSGVGMSSFLLTLARLGGFPLND
jgi:hypothetical protein